MATIIPAPAGSERAGRALQEGLMMLAQGLGQYYGQKKQQQQMAELAKSLSPPQIPTAGGEDIFTPGGAQNLTEGWLGGQPTETGMMQGVQLTPIQLLQKTLLAGRPMQEALGIARLADPEAALQQEYLQSRIGATKALTAQRKKPKPLKLPFTEGRIQQTLGELEAGGATDMLGTTIPFGSREDAVNHVLRTLGPEWENLAPKARGIIGRKWPAETEKKEKPSAPDWWAKQEEQQAGDKLSEIMPSLPLELMQLVNQAVNKGSTFSEILNSDELLPYWKK